MLTKQYTKYQNLLILVGILLRFYCTAEPQLWRDQAFSARAAKMDLFQMLQIVRRDTAPFLHYLLLHYWMKAFGASQFVIRLPNVLSGCCSILIFRSIVHKCFSDPNTILIALAAYVFMPLVICYDQMARIYSFVLLFQLVIYSTLLDIANKRDNNWTYFKITVFTVLGLYGFNLFLLVGFVNLLFLLYYGEGVQRAKVLFAYFLAGLIYLPLFVTFTLQQAKIVTQTHLPFYMTISLFIIFMPIISHERGPSTASQIDIAIRFLAFAIGSAFLIITAILWLKKEIQLKNKQVTILFKWMLFVLAIFYIYSLRSTIASPRYLLFFAPIMCLLLADLYKDKKKFIIFFLLFIVFISVYELQIGYIYKGDVRKMIKDVDYNEKSLILASDGISYHTFKYYSPYPVSIYDPYRKLPYYDGISIFEESDYYFQQSFEQYSSVYVIYFRFHDELARKLQDEGFGLEFNKLYKGRDYSLEKWSR